ncbi:hypothetical protein BH11ACT7_BH11ACT7_17160 [soil metagenome]
MKAMSENFKTNLRNGAAGAVCGGALLFTAGLGVAGATPPPPPPPPGCDEVVTQDAPGTESPIVPCTAAEGGTAPAPADVPLGSTDAGADGSGVTNPTADPDFGILDDMEVEEGQGLTVDDEQ